MVTKGDREKTIVFFCKFLRREVIFVWTLTISIIVKQSDSTF